MALLYGVIYSIADGRPWQYMTASAERLLLQQVPPEGYALLPVEAPPSPDTFSRMAVVQGELVAKTETVITATPNPFAADGVTECMVSLTPFVPCTLRVNGTPYALTVEDPALVITSDEPRTFTLTLDWLPTHGADPLTVIAEEP